jgi:hypothetical protein
MTTSTNKLIDIDREFDDVHFDETSIKRITNFKKFYEENPDKIRKGEKNPFFGKKHSEETRKLLSETHIGLQAGEKNPMYGRTHTEEVKQQSRDRNKLNCELKGGGTFLGKNHSEESKKLMSEKRGTRATRELKSCYAIDPSGTRFDFNSITECSKILDYPSLMGNAHKLFPKDGTLWNVKQGKFKGWSFARVI